MVFPTVQLPTWNDTVTVLNKRDGLDSPDRLDAWKKTVLRGCFWVGEQTQGQSGHENIESASYLLRVPQSADYRPYPDWKEDMEGFTFSPGDYIIHGEVFEPVSAKTVQRIAQIYLFRSFQVRFFKDNTKGPLPHYRLEGV